MFRLELEQTGAGVGEGAGSLPELIGVEGGRGLGYNGLKFIQSQCQKHRERARANRHNQRQDPRARIRARARPRTRTRAKSQSHDQ